MESSCLASPVDFGTSGSFIRLSTCLKIILESMQSLKDVQRLTVIAALNSLASL